uniref:Uncharacterized protein n=1 Tax=Avena sativa TaxID=4498 RepID=A0ACD5WVZ0_AVESA
MYAVGKVLYTVAAPFHPFGGAVDIVVVQQQDGSFKSSPWYVRFGKFQGVLKAKEKVVKIAVNGVEAGFNMYLDSNGEAHFLRDADPNIAEGDFVVSASSSGDGQVEPTQDTQLRKSKSIACDISTMEASSGDAGKVLARRSTILERMFGRKSIKDSAHAVDRVGSLERAEIAAELLDTNWSTSRGSEARSSNHEPSSSHHTDAGKANQVETTNMVFPDCSFDHYKAVGPNCDNVDNTIGNPHAGRRSSGDEKEHCTQTTSVKEEVVAICTHNTGDFTEGIISTIDQAGSESLANDTDTGKSTKDPVDTQGELQGNFEDGTIREMHVEEVLSHGIFEIRAIETNITNGRNEVVAQFVAVGSDAVSQNFTQTNSPTCSTTYFSSERHDGSLIDCGHDACQEKVVSISSPEIVESSYDVSSILADKVHDAKGISLTDGLQSEECSRVSSEKLEEMDVEERSLSYHGDCSNKEGIYNLDVPEVSVFENLNYQTFQTNLSDKGIHIDTLVNDHMDNSVDTLSNDHSTRSDNNLACQNVLVFPDASSSGIDMLCYVHENDLDTVSNAHSTPKDQTLETKTCHGEHDVSFILTSEMEVVSRECPAQIDNFPSKVEVEVSPIIFGSSLSEVNTENTKLDYDENRSSSASGVEIGPVPEEPGDGAESVVSLSKLVENTIVLSDKLGIETSPIISDSSSLSEVEAKNAELEDNVNRSSSASGVEIGPVPEEPRDEAEAVVLLSKLVENTTVLPNKLGIETSPIISDSSSLSEADAENTKLEDNVKRPSSACGVEIRPVPDDPRDRAETVVSISRLVEKTTVWPNKLEVEISPIISDSLNLSEAEAENTKPEDNVNRPSSACGIEIRPVPDDPRDRAETVVSISRLVEKTTVWPNKLEVEISPIISDSSNLSEAEAENIKLEGNVNRPSSACGVEVRRVPDDPRDRAETVVSVSKLVENTTVLPNKLGIETSPIISDSSSLSEADAENTKLEDNVKRPSSACGVEIRPVPDDPRDRAETVVSVSRLVEKTTVCPNKLEVEISPIISDSSNLSEAEAENTKLEGNVNRPSSACGDEIRPVPDDPRDRAETVVSVSMLVEKTTVCANKLETEISPIVSELSSLSTVEAKHTKLEDNVNRPGSGSGVEVGPVPDDPRDKAETIVSSCEFLDEIQFQFSDTRSFADGNTLDDVVANKASGGVVHDEADGNADEEEGDDVDVESKPENYSDLSRPETSIIPIPGSELHLGDNNLEAKSLPNLRSHIQDLERSVSFQASCSLCNSESSVVDPGKSKISSFPEQELEGTGESKQDICPSELTNNPVPDDKNPDDLRVDSFSPFVELSLCRHMLSEGMGADAACRAFDAEKITLEKFRATKQSLISDNKLVVRIAGRYFPWDVASPVVLGMVSFSEEQVFEHQGMIKVERVEPSTTQVSSWRIWPFSFRRTSTMNAIQPVCETVSESTVESTLSNPVKDLDGERNKTRVKRMDSTVSELDKEENKSSVKRVERKVQSLTPTSEELASLDLREGRNVVTFTFSTAMLGIQQVDANIYLWKWNTHIVISDVDGTITKSDVLGQFMPMVGVDWSQNGVAHLFSAIKENGYQLLFLSARSISQAHLTRQFLFNLKQDGKALPDGPVVISPDGLFPSLYREVIRRAPHEFKIACLGAIKALFPPDSHPFYAGFGNRDTDEFSYLKVGIPMGKIFIINPKGEVAVNRRVNTTKSYMSLHALVNRMFPPISSPPEQEDFNTWNYWKMPLPDI